MSPKAESNSQIQNKDCQLKADELQTTCFTRQCTLRVLEVFLIEKSSYGHDAHLIQQI